MPEPTVRQQQSKCKDLRGHLVAYVNAKGQGVWTLGVEVVREVMAALCRKGIFTSGEVLAKELRHARRKGEITKRKRPGTVYVEYTANTPSGQLFDNSQPTHHGQ